MPAANSALVALVLIVASTTAAVTQDNSHLVIRPANVPDSLKRALIVRSYDTVKVRQNWNKLRKGQTASEVRALLGLPLRGEFDGINGWNVWWYGMRNVAFNSVTNRVSPWDATLDH